MRPDPDAPWYATTCASGGGAESGERGLAGAVELWPRPGGAGETPQACYRLALLREYGGWRLVTEWLGAGPTVTGGDASWSSVADSLGDFRAEVERLWGEPIWLALLRAAAGTVQEVAPKAMEPKLDLLISAGARPAWAGA